MSQQLRSCSFYTNEIVLEVKTNRDTHTWKRKTKVLKVFLVHNRSGSQSNATPTLILKKFKRKKKQIVKNLLALLKYFS